MGERGREGGGGERERERAGGGREREIKQGQTLTFRLLS